MRGGRSGETLGLVLEDLVIAAIELIVGKMRISLRHSDVAVARKFLREFEVSAGTTQNGGYKVVPKGVRRDDRTLSISERFYGSRVDDRACRRG